MSDPCTQPQYLNHFNLWGVNAYRIWGMSTVHLSLFSPLPIECVCVCVRARAVHEELDL